LVRSNRSAQKERICGKTMNLYEVTIVYPVTFTVKANNFSSAESIALEYSDRVFESSSISPVLSSINISEKEGKGINE